MYNVDETNQNLKLKQYFPCEQKHVRSCGNYLIIVKHVRELLNWLKWLDKIIT